MEVPFPNSVVHATIERHRSDLFDDSLPFQYPLPRLHEYALMFRFLTRHIEHRDVEKRDHARYALYSFLRQIGDDLYYMMKMKQFNLQSYKVRPRDIYKHRIRDRAVLRVIKRMYKMPKQDRCENGD